ncbi:hypothetical protein K493DRAFT_358390 [Basidiobolus meristosporus CBS 931.73]|uniref:Uncharacterized protein n=1 Tax=Basidiobolus meristosporus CBS 931.73 TaxID=1314790 RepID=A0A1Y1XUA6_9FUNG|nr:hypothetical protein K493DRAFT_358390 [Basidiobolus meristosporus CBS 931.73]|eukprot:ORX89303.1 hypothetical protein K493DRAFT_358390 [Basidiobolus meristosporus CBS 931.73]
MQEMDTMDDNSRINEEFEENERFSRRREAEEEEMEDGRLASVRGEFQRLPNNDEIDDFPVDRNRLPLPQRGRIGRPNRGAFADINRDRGDNIGFRGTFDRQPSRFRENEPNRGQQFLDNGVPEPHDMPWNGMPFMNRPMQNPRDCIVLTLNNGAVCLDPKSFGNGDQPLPQD